MQNVIQTVSMQIGVESFTYLLHFPDYFTKNSYRYGKLYRGKLIVVGFEKRLFNPTLKKKKHWILKPTTFGVAIHYSIYTSRTKPQTFCFKTMKFLGTVATGYFLDDGLLLDTSV